MRDALVNLQFFGGFCAAVPARRPSRAQHIADRSGFPVRFQTAAACCTNISTPGISRSLTPRHLQQMVSTGRTPYRTPRELESRRLSATFRVFPMPTESH